MQKNIKFRSDIGFNHIILIRKKEQPVVIPLSKTISAEKIKLQYKILENDRVWTDMYFSQHKFFAEIDEKRHTDRNQNEENEIQTKIEKLLDCKFFPRINSEFKIGRRESERHRMFRFKVAVTVIWMFQLRWGLKTATSNNGALKGKQKFPARIIIFRRSSYQETTWKLTSTFFSLPWS